jgi:opacity protein-like surface antigen
MKTNFILIKIKMKTILFVLVMLASTNIFSQSNSIGIKTGASFSNVISKRFMSNNEQKIGIVAGITYDYSFSKHFFAGVEANYEQRGFKNYIIFTDINGNPTGRKEPTHFQYDYLSLPVKLGYRVGNKFFGFAGIGIIPAYMIKATAMVPAFGENFVVIGQTISKSHIVSKFDFGGLAEIGGGFIFKENFSLNISFRYQRSFTSISNDNYFPTSEIRHITMQPSIGIKYSFTDKGNKKANTKTYLKREKPPGAG